jgi:hypothetical protein
VCNYNSGMSVHSQFPGNGTKEVTFTFPGGGRVIYISPSNHLKEMADIAFKCFQSTHPEHKVELKRQWLRTKCMMFFILIPLKILNCLVSTALLSNQFTYNVGNPYNHVRLSSCHSRPLNAFFRFTNYLENHLKELRHGFKTFSTLFEWPDQNVHLMRCSLSLIWRNNM